ncbi:hypothetical protein SEA_REINDEER_126 [Mycobacterium phage Reindeer]|uniref:Uncharacterized protein n=1 Tax=Mycobacterium phage Reindeer TaxID=2762283 RepID=A0A7G8LI45_9CAUD|nr:hypothetical protein J4U05_gp126 [Mycobacterium phage Reindeer]QNJ56917.1 hypothetical protein SEA_REINDEER_126 [Mycobacterium phage Reindeer]
MRLTEKLSEEAQAISRRADTAANGVTREILYAEWSGLQRAIFLLKHYTWEPES